MDEAQRLPAAGGSGRRHLRPRAGERRRRSRALCPRHRRAGAPSHAAPDHGLLPGLGAYDGEALIEAAMLLPEWYLPPRRAADAAAEVMQAIARPGAPASPTCRRRRTRCCCATSTRTTCCGCRERPGVRACGLLDFQDAQRGHPSYDLVSLIEDARRDVSPAVHAACLARYLAATGLDRRRTSAPASR